MTRAAHAMQGFLTGLILGIVLGVALGGYDVIVSIPR